MNILRHQQIPVDFPARIKRLRGRLGLTQMRLAELIGVSYASVNRWENGHARPSLLAWQKIVAAEMTGLEGLLSTVVREDVASDIFPHDRAQESLETRHLGGDYLLPGQERRPRVPVLPAVHRRIRHTYQLSEPHLGESQAPPKALDACGEVHWNLLVAEDVHGCFHYNGRIQ